MLTAWPHDVYRSGATHAQQLIIGHTSKDGTASFYATAPLANATSAEWEAAMHRRFGRHAPEVMKQYPLERYEAGAAPAVTSSYIAADGDERVACPSREMAMLVTSTAPNGSAGRPAVYFFEFAHMMLNCDGSFETKMLPWCAKVWQAWQCVLRARGSERVGERARERARARERERWLDLVRSS